MDTTDNISFDDNVQLKARVYLSYSHLKAACHFARTAKEIETTFQTSKDIEELDSYVINGIISTVSFLESTINEFYSDVADNFLDQKALSAEIQQKITELWKIGIPKTARFPITEKFQIALILCQNKAFEKDKGPFQDVEILVKFRNYLIHYEPEWLIFYDSELDKKGLTTIQKKLEGRFNLKPSYSKDSVPFPISHLSYDALRWAISSSIQFVESFYSRLNTISKLEWLKEKIIF